MKRQINHIAKKVLTVHRQTSAASQEKPINKSLAFNVTRYTINSMIQSFSCTDTRDLFTGLNVARFVKIRAVAERKLAMLHRSSGLNDLRIPPNNRLEALKGDRKGQCSIRVNDPWRICFRFEAGHAFDVQIVDYH